MIDYVGIFDNTNRFHCKWLATAAAHYPSILRTKQQ